MSGAIDRRQFLTRTALGAAALTLPGVQPQSLPARAGRHDPERAAEGRALDARTAPIVGGGGGAREARCASGPRVPGAAHVPPASRSRRLAARALHLDAERDARALRGVGAQR